ncbi:MAG TPA: D-alanyl-D-alanine carboxypeptidase/D-alanyl-D-alanine-endopeptidase [Trichocoleus sp.]
MAFLKHPKQLKKAAALIPAIVAVLASAAEAAICAADVGPALDAIAAQPLLRTARVGVLVETQGATPVERQVVYQRDADRFFIPASNAKLLTTAAALDFLGPDYRIRTSVLASAAGGDSETASGLTSLRVVGRGDPSFSQQDLASLAQQITAAGVRQVSQLVADDSYFAGSAVNPNWEWEDVQAGYGAPVNSLILEGNALNLSLVPQAVGQPLRVIWEDGAPADSWQVINQSQTVAPGTPESVAVGRDLAQPVLYVQGQLVAGSDAEEVAIAIPTPAQNFVAQLQRALVARGVLVGRTAVVQDAAAGGFADMTELAFHQSPPLSELLIPTNRNSNNLYAEALLKTVGVRYFSQATETPNEASQNATAAGVIAATAVLTRIGLAPSSFVLADGSGLSRHNLVTPSALVEVLQRMATHPRAAVYRSSLSVAGVSGTLRNRLRGTSLEGNFYGKSGAVSGNVSLSGYLNAPNYQPLVVSILINNSNQRAGQLRQVIDDMLLTLAQVEDCSDR